jgi:hypothetical protein
MAFPPSDIRELAEANEFYRATKADYIARGELLTLALFDCALQTTRGAFQDLKHLVNCYAMGDIPVSHMHSQILRICIEASGECGGSNWPLKVFRHEFHLLLGGLSPQQVAEAQAYHEEWRRNCAPLFFSPLPPSPLIGSRSLPHLPAPLAIYPPAGQPIMENIPSTEWDGQIHAPLPASPCAKEPECEFRPSYNDFTWPSPLPKLVALEAGLTTNKRCKHVDAIALIAKRLKCTPQQFCEMTRAEVKERLFDRDHYWAPGASAGVFNLLTQRSRYW